MEEKHEGLFFLISYYEVYRVRMLRGRSDLLKIYYISRHGVKGMDL